MTDANLFQLALTKVIEARTTYPWSQALEWIQPQLEYLLRYRNGEVDGSRIADMTIGILTVKEVDDLDPELGKLLTRIHNLISKE